MSDADEMMTETVLTIGQQLKKAREAKGLKTDKIAEQLRLSDACIHDLEEDNYDNIPVAAYIRGYIRNYAMALGLPEGPLLAEFDQLDLPVKKDTRQVVRLRLNFDRSKKYHQFKRWWQVIGSILLITLAVFLGYQYQHRPHGSGATVLQPGETSNLIGKPISYAIPIQLPS